MSAPNTPETTPPVTTTPPTPDPFQVFAEETNRRLASQEQTQAEILNTLRVLSQNVNAPPKQEEKIPLPPTYTKEQFFEDPNKVMHASQQYMLDVLRKDLDSQFAKLNHLAELATRPQITNQHVSRLLNNPATADVKDFQGIFESLLAQHNGPIDDNVLTMLYYMARGIHTKSGGTNTPPKTTPAYIPPAAPPNNTSTTHGVKLPELTEQQKAVARGQGMDDIEYMYWNGMINQQVYDSIKGKK